MSDEERARYVVQSECCDACECMDARSCGCFSNALSILAAVRAEEREACARIALDGCLVPPDGGSPTEDERLMCEHITAAIRARGP